MRIFTFTLELILQSSQPCLGLKMLIDFQIMHLMKFLVLPVHPSWSSASGGQQEDTSSGQLPVTFPIVFIPLYVTRGKHGQTGLVRAAWKPFNLTLMGKGGGWKGQKSGIFWCEYENTNMMSSGLWTTKTSPSRIISPKTTSWWWIFSRKYRTASVHWTEPGFSAAFAAISPLDENKGYIWASHYR